MAPGNTRALKGLFWENLAPAPLERFQSQPRRWEKRAATPGFAKGEEVTAQGRVPQQPSHRSRLFLIAAPPGSIPAPAAPVATPSAHPSCPLPLRDGLHCGETVAVLTLRVEAGLAALPQAHGKGQCPAEAEGSCVEQAQAHTGVHTQPAGPEPRTPQDSGGQSRAPIGQLHHTWATFSRGTPRSVPAPRSLHRPYPCRMLAQAKPGAGSTGAGSAVQGVKATAALETAAGFLQPWCRTLRRGQSCSC